MGQGPCDRSRAAVARAARLFAAVLAAALLTAISGGSAVGLTAPGGLTFDGIVTVTVTTPGSPAAETRRVTTRDRCTTIESWYGPLSDVPSNGTVNVALHADALSSTSCPPKPVLRGSIHDAAGRPLSLVIGQASISVPPDDGALTLPLDVHPDGSYEVALPALGTHERPAEITVTALSHTTRTEPVGDGCERSYAEQGVKTIRVALGEGEALGGLDVATHEVVIGEECGIVGTAGNPSGAGPALTLPPTDAAASGEPQRSETIVLVVFGVLAVVGGSVAAGLPGARGAIEWLRRALRR